MSILNLKDVNINETVNKIIINNKELLSVKELLNILNYNFNELYIDKFWNSIENDKWIYIDNEMLKYIGYSDIDINSSKRAYIIILKDNFEEDNDFKLLNNKEFIDISKCIIMHLENIEINNHNKTKHLIISPDCFKQSLMLLKTKKSKDIISYYIELEKIFKFYLEYQNLHQKKILEDKEKELENKQIELEKTKDKVMDMERDFKHKELEVNEFIYIATNVNYHKQNVYKIGKSNRLNKREKQFNTFFINGQKMHYIYIFQCHNSRVLEQLLFTCLSNYKYNTVNELFNINLCKLYKMVYNICCKYNSIINFSNTELFDSNIDQILLNDVPASQTYPINYQNNKNEEYDELLLKKYVNNKNISNMIIKDFKEYDFEDHMLLNNKALIYDKKTKYYYLTYHNKMIYVCTNCGIFKKDKRGFEQHINKRNKCDTSILNLNTIEDIERELINQKVTLYSCNNCDIVFKTNDHYKRHLEINCKKK
jgi:hypothetical protein